jgi:hypothetical protein
MTRRTRLACTALGVLLAGPALWLRMTGDLPASLPVFRLPRR